jgi:hypothetical protein
MHRRQFVKSLLLLAAGVGTSGLVSPLLARVGRPASPNSVAGVNRRTTRRRRRRVRRRVRRGMTLSTLPYGCTTTRVRGGVKYYYCGGIWYRPQYSGTTVVYVVDDIEAGANTDVEFED